MKRWSFLLPLLAVIGLLPTSIILASPTRQRLASYYYVQGKRVEVSIATDLIAVITDDARQPSAAAFEAGERLERDDELAGFRQEGVFFVQLAQAMAPTALDERQSELQERSDVQQTGLVAYLPEAELPVVVTDEIIVKFKAGVDSAEQASLHEQLGAEVVRPDPYVADQYLLRVKAGTGKNALDVANAYFESGKTEFAHPNFIVHSEERQAPDDPLYPNQWHLRNTGQGGGVPNADVAALQAWAITQGDPAVVIAVIDIGVQIGHEDLVANRFINRREVEGNLIDDDGNGYIDDVSGWNFYERTPNTDRGHAGRHGTAVAGVAAARGNNQLGVSGICLHCMILPIAHGRTVQDHAEAFRYAVAMGAHILTNSWGYAIGTPTTDVVVHAINEAATQGRNGLGAVVLFAMTNEEIDNCSGAQPDISSLPNVIAVSRSTNQDRFGRGGFGDCMDLIAPTRGGTLGITTTDQVGFAGYDSGNYFDDFGGTSSATPLVAGIAGLMLHINPNLTRLQVQQILQNSADQIDAAVAQFDANGFSRTHGYGRVNAGRAVAMARDAAGPPPERPVTATLLLVRHAETDESVDPTVLTPVGRARAQQLLRSLQSAGITAIYASSAPQTQATVQPLAEALNLPINQVDDAVALAERVKTEHPDGVVLIVHHGVTLPGIIAAVGGDPASCPLVNEFDNLCLVQLIPPATVRVLQLKYGEPTALVTAPPFEPPTGEPDVTLARNFQIEVECSTTELRTAVATLTWEAEERFLENQRPAVTVYKNGFAEGRFATLDLSAPEPRFERFGEGERAATRDETLPLRLMVRDIDVDLRDDAGFVSIQVSGLEPGLNYFWLVATPTDERWVAGEVIRVEAPVCPADMVEDSAADQ